MFCCSGSNFLLCIISLILSFLCRLDFIFIIYTLTSRKMNSHAQGNFFRRENIDRKTKRFRTRLQKLYHNKETTLVWVNILPGVTSRFFDIKQAFSSARQKTAKDRFLVILRPGFLDFVRSIMEIYVDKN